MAITHTSTGSHWKSVEGTSDEVVNYLMTSGLGTIDVAGVTSPAVGSLNVLYQS